MLSLGINSPGDYRSKYHQNSQSKHPMPAAKSRWIMPSFSEHPHIDSVAPVFLVPITRSLSNLSTICSSHCCWESQYLCLLPKQNLPAVTQSCIFAQTDFSPLPEVQEVQAHQLSLVDCCNIILRSRIHLDLSKQ